MVRLRAAIASEVPDNHDVGIPVPHGTQRLRVIGGFPDTLRSEHGIEDAGGDCTCISENRPCMTVRERLWFRDFLATEQRTLGFRVYA